MNLKNRNRADTFAIAVAQLKGAVTVGGNENRPKIPYVCDQLGGECIGFLDLIRR